MKDGTGCGEGPERSGRATGSSPGGPREQGPFLWSEAGSPPLSQHPIPVLPAWGWGGGTGGAVRTGPAASYSPQTQQCQVKSTWVSPEPSLTFSSGRGPPGRAKSPRTTAQGSCQSFLPQSPHAGPGRVPQSHRGSLAQTWPCPMLPLALRTLGPSLIRNPCRPGCPPALQRGFPLLSLHCSPRGPGPASRPG